MAGTRVVLDREEQGGAYTPSPVSYDKTGKYAGHTPTACVTVQVIDVLESVPKLTKTLDASLGSIILEIGEESWMVYGVRLKNVRLEGNLRIFSKDRER